MATVNPNIRITAAVRFDTDAGTGGKILKQTLKQQSGIDTRRLSRLSLIAALGAVQLKEQCEIRSDCAVFLGTPFSSPSVFEKMADNVLNHHAAMPFDFISNLHNSPVFHAAQVLGTHGATLVVTADNNIDTCFHPVSLAMQSVQKSGQAAVGWAYEHQAARANTHEGSIWIVLEAGAEQGVPVVLNDEVLQADRPSEKPQYYWQNIADWIEAVMAHEGRRVKKCTLA